MPGWAVWVLMWARGSTEQCGELGQEGLVRRHRMGQGLLRKMCPWPWARREQEEGEERSGLVLRSPMHPSVSCFFQSA